MVFGSLSNEKSKGSAYVLLAREVEKIWKCSCWEKGNFIIINEFKYGQTWKNWPSPLSLSLYGTFKHFFKFHWKHPCWSIFLIKLQAWTQNTFLRSPFLYRTSLVAASVYIQSRKSKNWNIYFKVEYSGSFNKVR